jgi:hypothetical protein
MTDHPKPKPKRSIAEAATGAWDNPGVFDISGEFDSTAPDHAPASVVAKDGKSVVGKSGFYLFGRKGDND